MPKRRRLTPMKSKSKTSTPAKTKEVEEQKDQEVNTARGRLKGALMGIMEPTLEESEDSSDYTPAKRDKKVSSRESNSDDEDSQNGVPQRQSYVLKLFDRSVDLSQFNEDTPLYPICRAWMINQPRADYTKFAVEEKEDPITDGVELPGPEGPPVSRIPELLPEQLAANKDNIDLYCRGGSAPSREQLLGGHAARWAGVRGAWVAQAQNAHARYRTSRQLLHAINVGAL